MEDDTNFVRHTVPLIFDVPAELPQNQGERAVDALNLLTTCIMDLIADDKRVQGIMRRHGIEWGWGEATWESEEGP
ncbi:MAG: hypothetical protein AAGF83_18165 [Cyanobacteria bacterium P01_G01_bin.67]